jgi:hypothetical protein
MAMQVGPDNPDNPGQVSDKTRTDTDTPLRGVRCPDGLLRGLRLPLQRYDPAQLR